MDLLQKEKQGTFLRASLSDICNFDCQYCATDMGMENHTPLSLHAPLLSADDYIKNMEMIAKHGFQNISFTGGEPLLNRSFGHIAKGCRQIFKLTEITTNGTNLVKNIDVIKECIDVLKISIDSLDPVMAATIAHNENASKTPQIIEECCKSGIKTIGLNFVYMKQNAAQLPAIVNFANRLKKEYGTDVYISILDLYYSKAKEAFWKDQFVDLRGVREQLIQEGKQLQQRLRVGCDSYHFIWNDVVVNMKDSISCTHRASICEKCSEYCQEGIYCLKHSASGWISVCPSNKISLGAHLATDLGQDEAHEKIDRYVKILNSINRMEQTGEEFFQRRGLHE